MNAATLKDAIKAKVLELGDQSFGNLATQWPEHFLLDNDNPDRRALYAGDNVLLWDGVSRVGAEAIKLLREDDDIITRGTQHLVYLIDSPRLFDLPIAEPNKTYKKLHWQPVLFESRAVWEAEQKKQKKQKRQKR